MLTAFTATQLETMTKVVKGQCEATHRMNAWRYNYGPESTFRRQRSFRLLQAMAASSIGFRLEDMPPADVMAISGLVVGIVEEYDRLNHIAPAF